MFFITHHEYTCEILVFQKNLPWSIEILISLYEVHCRMIGHISLWSKKCPLTPFAGKHSWGGCEEQDSKVFEILTICRQFFMIHPVRSVEESILLQKNICWLTLWCDVYQHNFNFDKYLCKIFRRETHIIFNHCKNGATLTRTFFKNDLDALLDPKLTHLWAPATNHNFLI